MSKIAIQEFPQVYARAQINFHIAKIIITKISKNQHHMPNKIFHNQNFIPTNLPTKFCHVHESKFTNASKTFSHEYFHPRLTQIFHTAILSKSKPKFIQQHHNLPKLSKFQKPPTLSKLHHEKKKTLQENSKVNITKHDQSYNVPKFQDHQMTISHYETFNETCNNIFPSKETKEKLTMVST